MLKAGLTTETGFCTVCDFAHARPIMLSILLVIYIDKEIQPCGAYDRSTRCWPLLLRTGKAKVELLLDIQLE